MKRGAAVAMIFFGVVFILLGLLFLAGAAGQGRRMLIGVAGLGLGAVAVGYGVRAVKAAEASSPERIRAEIMALAAKRNGEITAEDLAAALGQRVHASATVLDLLLSERTCRRRVAGDTVFYVFPELQPRLMMQKCEYCGTDFELADEVDKCPNCGGRVETRVASYAVGEGEVFHMDEEGDF